MPGTMDEGLTRRELIAGTAAAVGLPLAACATGSAATGAPARHRLKVVVVGGHPDDPETMAGGTVARLVEAGAEVTCLYLTRGEGGVAGKSPEEAAALRTAEAHQACEVLGTRARFAGQVDGATEVNAARYDALCKLLEEEAPELVITHWPVDSHRDHRAASLLVYDAWLRLERRFTLYYGEVLTGIQTQVFSPTHYVDIAAVEPRKRAACYAHASQGPVDFYPLHEQMQRFRGLECGCAQAEAFILQPQGALGLVPTRRPPPESKP